MLDNSTANVPAAATPGAPPTVASASPFASVSASTTSTAPAVSDSASTIPFTGLAFLNSFPDAKYMGVSFPGLCGGMSYTALDYYFANKKPPTITKTPSVSTKLGAYVRQRQWDSLVGANGARFLSLLANPDDGALAASSTGDEWSKLKSYIDAGMPVTIGLVPSPWKFFMNAPHGHQVVAVGYTEDPSVQVTGGRVIKTWNPNHGMSDLVYGQDGHWHGGKNAGGEEWRGFFVEDDYKPRPPPAVADALKPASSDGMMVPPVASTSSVASTAALLAQTAALTTSPAAVVPIVQRLLIDENEVRTSHPYVAGAVAFVAAGAATALIGYFVTRSLRKREEHEGAMSLSPALTRELLARRSFAFAV